MGIAALLAGKIKKVGQQMAVVISGGNVPMKDIQMVINQKMGER